MFKETFKPAIPNRKTQTLIEGNARNWAHTVILILRDHYTESIEEEVKALFEFPNSSVVNFLRLP